MKWGYCRVSTRGQLDGNSIEEQSNRIKELYNDAEIVIESYSGAKERPIFNELIGKLNSGDILVVTKLDRFCRTTKEGLQFIDLLMNAGVKIHILNMGLIENSAMGRLIVTNLLAFAEFERAMIIERTQSGKAIAKTKGGFKEGRPQKYTVKQIELALQLLETNSYKEVEESTGISKSTLIRARRSKMSINEQMIEALSEFEQGTILTTDEIIEKLHAKYDTNRDSIIPSDYCYNRSNNGIDFNNSIHLFEYIKRGQYKYLGRGYKYNGAVYQLQKGEKDEKRVGSWSDGIFKEDN